MVATQIPLLDTRTLGAPDEGRRDASMTWMRLMGIDPNDPTTFGTLRDYGVAVEDEPWTYAVIFKTATACQSVPLLVYLKQGRELVPIADAPAGPLTDAGQRLQHLLDWVNPFDMTGSDLKAANAIGWFLYGGYYLQKVRGRYGGEPQELYWLSPPDVEADAPDGRVPRMYHYRPAKAPPVDIPPGDIIAHRRPHPKDPLVLLSPLSAVRNEIQVQIQASIHTKSLLSNNSIPAHAIVAQKGAELTANDTRVLQRVMKAIRGPKGAGRTPIITQPVELQNIAVSAVDAEYIAAREIARKATCAVLGMPPVVAGDDDKTNVYGNWRDARKAWWQDTLITYLDGQADSYNNWLVPEFDPSGQLVVAYDYSQIEALQEPWATQVNGWLMLQDRGVVVPNETRSHFRLGRPTSWGDQPMPQTKLTLKGDAVAGSGLGTELFGTVPVPVPMLVAEPGGLTQPGVPDTGMAERAARAARIRAYGDHLYKHPAVRAFGSGGELDATWLLGEPVSPTLARTLAAALRRRDSAERIADALLEMT